MRTLLIGTVAIGLVLGLAWPANDGSVEGSPTEVEVLIPRSSDHHFYADAKIDDKSVRLLVDTGSSAIALSEKDARKIGIDVPSSDFQLIGQGASGLVRGKAIRVKRIEVGKIRLDHAEIMVVEGADVSLLGQPFLEQVDEIIIRKDQMLLRSKTAA